MSPLAERMRPHSLDTYFGQDHLMGEGAPLRKMLEKGTIHSCIFWGPPGVGKTSLARLISIITKKKMISLSAINSGVKDVREAIDKASKRDFFNTTSPILFIDEIHRFNKSQQDSLLEAVEKGIVILIGATTENPSFEVNQALLSRCQLYVLKDLTASDLIAMANHAIKNDEFLAERKISISEYDALIYFSGGDARKFYNILEILSSLHEGSFNITNALVEDAIKVKNIAYDKGGEMHYDLISAFIKSIRGSDPQAAVYWLARMLNGGEDPIFICRRMIIAASEDIGLANPNALLMAINCLNAVHQIGMPEGRIIMSQCAVYLATSLKSNSTYIAINKAMEVANKTGNLPVPLHLRNAPTALMKSLNYGKEYLYAHDYTDNFVKIDFLPPEIRDEKFYTPGSNPSEDKIKDFLNKRWG